MGKNVCGKREGNEAAFTMGRGDRFPRSQRFRTSTVSGAAKLRMGEVPSILEQHGSI